MAGTIAVEVVFGLPDRQELVEVTLPRGATLAEAIAASGIAERFAEHDLAGAATGVWGKPVPRDRVLRNGDRVEIYRALTIDPREARRQRAAAGRTMSMPDEPSQSAGSSS